VSALTAADSEAPGTTPGAPLPLSAPDQASLNRRELFALLGSAMIASAGARPPMTSGAAETLAVLARPGTQPLTGVAPAVVANALPGAASASVGASRAARLLRFTSSSRDVFRAVTRFVGRDPNLSGAWVRLATALGGTRVEAAAPAGPHSLGGPSGLPGAARPARLRLTRSGHTAGRVALRRGLAVSVGHAARNRRGHVWTAVRRVADSPAPSAAPPRRS
jgi:hypothetical protein